jgi:hypothetical protein
MRSPIELDDGPLPERVQEWAAGKATLKELRGYTADELYAIARSAHVFYRQGRIEPARVLFHGLRDASAWVGRAEVRIASGDGAEAISDLRRAQAIAATDHPLRAKIDALLHLLKLR